MKKGMARGPTPNVSAYEHASDNAAFKRGADWQTSQNKPEARDEINAADENGSKSRQRERDRERRTKKKGKASRVMN